MSLKDKLLKAATRNTATGLMTTGDAVLGKRLVEAAQAANRQTLQTQAVGAVQGLLHDLEKQRDYLASTEQNIAILEARIAAVEAGAITIDKGGRLCFTDAELNGRLTKMAECPNCGYAGHRSLEPARG